MKNAFGISAGGHCEFAWAQLPYDKGESNGSN